MKRTSWRIDEEAPVSNNSVKLTEQDLDHYEQGSQCSMLDTATQNQLGSDPDDNPLTNQAINLLKCFPNKPILTPAEQQEPWMLKGGHLKNHYALVEAPKLGYIRGRTSAGSDPRGRLSLKNDINSKVLKDSQ